MKLKKTIAGLGAAGAVFAGSVLVAVPAMAQDDTADTDTTEDSTVEAPHRHRRHTNFAAVADVLGIDMDELRERLENSETIADIAAEQGVAIDDVVASLMGEAEVRLDSAVADERLTQAEADDKLVEIEDHITDLVNGEIEFRAHGPGGVRGFGFGEATDLLGLDGAELMDLLRDGATLADIAADQGVGLDDLADAITSPVEERLAEAVANGDLTQEEADEKLAEIAERTDDLINGELPAGGSEFGRRGGFGPRGGEGFGPAPSDAGEGATTGA